MIAPSAPATVPLALSHRESAAPPSESVLGWTFPDGVGVAAVLVRDRDDVDDAVTWQPTVAVDLLEERAHGPSWEVLTPAMLAAFWAAERWHDRWSGHNAKQQRLPG